MTIKQQGGIFGRNPTFNEVDVDNDLSVGSDLLYVDVSEGKVGINTSTPGARLSGSILNIDDASVSGIELSNGGSSATEIFADGSKTVISERRAGSIVFRTSGTNERMNIGAGGDVTVSTGNLVIGTSGKGIDFSATSGTGTSELFDDYEEGSWTPAIRYVNSTDNGNATETVQSGKYLKIGRMVMAEWRLDFTQGSGSPAASTVLVTGLPFSGLDNFYNTSGTANTSVGTIQMYSPNAGATEAALSIDGATLGSGSRIVRGTIIYQAQ